MKRSSMPPPPRNASVGCTACLGRDPLLKRPGGHDFVIGAIAVAAYAQVLLSSNELIFLN